MSSRKLKVVDVDTYDVDTVDIDSVVSLDLQSARSSAASSPAPSDGMSSGSSFPKRFFFHKELCDKHTGQPVSDDIRHGYKLLQHFMSPSIKKCNSCFMSDIQAKDKASPFYIPSSKSLILPQMKEKFETSQYASLTEFVRDVRSMLERYIRYYGPQHSVAGHCEKLEGIMLQKIALLPRKFQEMCTVEKTGGRCEVGSGEWAVRPVRKTVHNLSSTLIQQLEQEAKEREKEEKKRHHVQREKDKEALKNELACWESSLFDGPHMEQMLSSWELPQIGLFLYLCQTPLNCGEITQCEVERMLLLCRESEAMALTMTSLLSSPFQRQYLDRRPPMPYHVWSGKLSARLSSWYKTLQDADFNFEVAAVDIGIEPLFWHVVGRLRNPLISRQFHELTYLQRIWIVKSLCDSCMATQSSLRDAIDRQSSDDTRPQVLGTDGAGYTYLDFPQFCGDNVRIYKMDSGRRPGRKRTNQALSCATPKHSRRSVTPVDVCSMQSSTSPLSTSRASTPPSKPASDAVNARALRLARRSAKFEDWRDFKKLKTADPISTSPDHNPEQTVDSPRHSPVEEVNGMSVSLTSRAVGGSGDNHIGEEVGCESDSGQVTNHMASSDGYNRSPDRLSHDDALIETKQEVETNLESFTPSTDVPRDVKNEIVSDLTNRTDSCKVEALSADECSAVDALSSLHQTEAAKKPSASEETTPDLLEPELDLLTDTSDSYACKLVCQSVDELRGLCDSFCNGRGREVELYEELEHLLKDLAPFETKLVQLHQKAKEKMKKQQDEYVETTDQSHAEVNGEWESEEEPNEPSADKSEGATAVEKPEPECLPPRRSRNKLNGEVKPAVETQEEQTEEFGMSVFGRRRKRRVIPNNIEQGVFAKKKVRKDPKANKSTSPIITNTTTTVSASTCTVTTATSTGLVDSTSSVGEPVKVPKGYVLVKINKQLFIVPKAQLPSLLTQTNTAHVQVVNHEVKVVNPTAVKTIEALNSLPPTSTVNLTAGKHHGIHLPQKANVKSNTHSLPNHPLFSKYPLTLSTPSVSTATSTLTADTPVTLASVEDGKQKVSYICTKTGALVEQTSGNGKLKVQAVVTKTPTAMSLVPASTGSVAPLVIYTSISNSTNLSTTRGVATPTPIISPTNQNLPTDTSMLRLGPGTSRAAMVSVRAPGRPATAVSNRYTLQLPSATIQVPASAVRLVYNRPGPKAAVGLLSSSPLAPVIRRAAPSAQLTAQTSSARPTLTTSSQRKATGSTAVVLRPLGGAGVSPVPSMKAPVGGLILGTSHGIRLLQTGRVPSSTSTSVNLSPADVTSCSPVGVASAKGGTTITLSPQFVRTNARTQVIGNVSLVASPVRSGASTTVPQIRSVKPQTPRQIVHLQAGPRGAPRIFKAVRGSQPTVRYIMPRAGSGTMQVRTVLGAQAPRPSPQGQLIRFTTAQMDSRGKSEQVLTSPTPRLSQAASNPPQVVAAVSTVNNSSNVTLVLANAPASKPNLVGDTQARPAD